MWMVIQYGMIHLVVIHGVADGLFCHANVTRVASRSKALITASTANQSH